MMNIRCSHITIHANHNCQFWAVSSPFPLRHPIVCGVSAVKSPAPAASVALRLWHGMKLEEEEEEGKSWFWSWLLSSQALSFPSSIIVISFSWDVVIPFPPSSSFLCWRLRYSKHKSHTRTYQIMSDQGFLVDLCRNSIHLSFIAKFRDGDLLGGTLTTDEI